MCEQRFRRLLVLGLASLVLAAGCAARTETVAEAIADDNAAADPAPAGMRTSGYRLRVGDKIEVSFIAAPEIRVATPVTPDGTVTIPMAGEFVAVGRTTGELRQAIMDVMAEYIVDPSASVVLTDIADQPVFVLGEVVSPRRVSARGGLTVSMAIAEAGGFEAAGRPSSVMVIRTYGVEQPTAFKVDVTKVLSGRDPSEDLELMSNDVVYVPKSVIGKVGEFVDLFFNKIAPAQTFYLQGYRILDPSGERWLY